MQLELCFLSFFFLGYVLLRLDKMQKLRRAKGGYPQSSPFQIKLKQLRAAYGASNSAEVLEIWASVVAARFAECCPLDVLRMVMQCLIRDHEVDVKGVHEVTGYLSSFKDAYSSIPRSADEKRQRTKSPQQGVTHIVNQLLHVCVTRRAGLDECHEAFISQLRFIPNEETYEVLLSGHAAQLDEDRVESTLANMNRDCKIVTPRAYTVVVNGFVRGRKLDVALSYMHKMAAVGAPLPNHVIIDIFKAGVAEDCYKHVFNSVKALPVTLPPESLPVMLEIGSRKGDADFCDQVAEYAREHGVSFVYNSYDALVKVHAQNASLKAIEYFEEMIQAGFHISEGSCVGMIAQCADSKFMNLAEHIVRHCRASGAMTLQTYSALMKVYAYSKLYDKACDLYHEITADGIQPDAMMFGCLMNFAVRAGRRDLSEELFKNSPFPVEVQNYMSQIRACRQARDVPRAMRLLGDMQAKGIADKAAFNSVLDVCVVADDLAQVDKLLEEMRPDHLDVVTYNTLIKGHCSQGRIQKAVALLDEMKVDNFEPNDVSYNSILNAFVCAREFDQAWKLVGRMKASGTQEDGYTLSTLLKALKTCDNTAFVRDVLGMLDSTEVDFTKDEVLLNVILDACVRLKDMRRLLLVVERVKNTKLNPSVATISTLMKAFSSLRRIDDVKELWHEMTVVREMEPNEISIGCVVDALVSNDKLDDAVELVKKWKDRVPVNCVIGSTLIKGFAIARDASRALEVFEMMEAEGITPNLVTLNTLLDAFARSGNMSKAAEILATIQNHAQIQPDRITYSTMIKGFCLQGQVDKAVKVMDSMHKHRLAPDPIIYNTILDGCVANDKFVLCDELFARMQKEHVKPSNFTLTVMIKRFGREGNLTKACECANSFPAQFGFKINVHALTCLISACLANRQLPRALKVFERMRIDGPAPDAMTYDKLINGCLRTGDVDMAVELVEHAYGLRGPIGHMSSMPGTKCPSGVVTPGGTVARVSALSPYILENMIDNLCRKGLAESKAVPLIEKLRAAKVPIPQKIFSSSLRGAVNESMNTRSRPWSQEAIPEHSNAWKGRRQGGAGAPRRGH